MPIDIRHDSKAIEQNSFYAEIEQLDVNNRVIMNWTRKTEQVWSSTWLYPSFAKINVTNNNLSQIMEIFYRKEMKRANKW